MTKLPFIHYSNPRFQNGREEVIYGQNTENLSWTYSDRLFEWYYKRRKEPGESDIDYWERVLEAALNKKVEIQCVIGGCNSSNGEGYYVFGYTDKEQNNE